MSVWGWGVGIWGVEGLGLRGVLGVVGEGIKPLCRERKNLLGVEGLGFRFRV